MRLTEFEVKSIIESFYTYFKTGKIYLFGSRVDDAAKGGDIKAKIGDQKIDIILSQDKEREIEKQALTRGVKLDLRKLKQDKVINECEKHLKRLQYAKGELKNIFPLTQKAYQELSQEDVQAIDQFIYRFTKLQDTIGEKLIKIVFSMYEENIGKYTFIDILNRLEKADILIAQEVQELRSVRNELAHNYEDDPMQSTIILNKVYEKEEILERIFKNIKSVLK